MLLVWELEVVSFGWHLGLCGRLVGQSGVERQGSSPEVLSYSLRAKAYPGSQGQGSTLQYIIQGSNDQMGILEKNTLTSM